LYPSHNCPPVALGVIDLTNAIGLRLKHFFLIHFFCHFSLFLMNIKTMKTSITDRFTEGVLLNSTLAIGGVSSPFDSFVVAESSINRTIFCAEKPAHRQSTNHYKQP
jgi:hypothetical protein